MTKKMVLVMIMVASIMFSSTMSFAAIEGKTSEKYGMESFLGVNISKIQKEKLHHKLFFIPTVEDKENFVIVKDSQDDNEVFYNLVYNPTNENIAHIATDLKGNVMLCIIRMNYKYGDRNTIIPSENIASYAWEYAKDDTIKFFSEKANGFTFSGMRSIYHHKNGYIVNSMYDFNESNFNTGIIIALAKSDEDYKKVFENSSIYNNFTTGIRKIK